MQIHNAHLTYCMNVHPTGCLADVLDHLVDHAAPIGKALLPNAPFGVGLWLPADAAGGLKNDPDPLRDTLEENGLYAFTMNGFPYGVFHGTRVKRDVYIPDWGDPRRLEYTLALLDILAAILPDGVDGSISTVPVTYGKELPEKAVEHLLAAAAAAREIRDRSGKEIRIALEPEPDCYLETTQEAVDFFAMVREQDARAAEHLSVCFDTCHLRLQGEDLAASLSELEHNDIAVAKIQVSAALVCDNRDGCAAREVLTPYDEPVYLHQTRVFDGDTEIARFADLGDALDANPAGRWLVHFHVPLPFEGDGALSSTADALTAEFFDLAFAQCSHIEVETYTFDVLPGPKPSVNDSIIGEMQWLLARV